MNIGYIGLGKMGRAQVERLKEKGHEPVVWNRSKDVYTEIKKEGIQTADSLESLCKNLPTPRLVWVMVTHTGLDQLLSELLPLLSSGDTVIDGGNSFYKDSVRRGVGCSKKGILFMDIGVSGGPAGARNGACLMIGGDPAKYKELESLFKDLSAPKAYQYMGKTGAGHFTKMVHNGIEYGMMQALAEGFETIKKAPFGINLSDAAKIYNNKSVIESRLVGWAEEGFKKYGEDLKDISSTVNHTGEGEWTVKTAEEFGVSVPIIKGSFDYRVESAHKPTFTGKVLSMLRNMFGGHSIK